MKTLFESRLESPRFTAAIRGKDLAKRYRRTMEFDVGPYLSVLVCGLLLGGCDSSSKNEKFFTEAKEAVKATLKDPDSAQFMKMRRVSALVPGACGEVNSKNSFGGYVGYEPFIFSSGSVYPGRPPAYLIDAMCKGEWEKQ